MSLLKFKFIERLSTPVVNNNQIINGDQVDDSIYKLQSQINASIPTFIQDTQPTYTGGPYYWIQTNIGGVAANFSVFFFT